MTISMIVIVTVTWHSAVRGRHLPFYQIIVIGKVGIGLPDVQ